MNKTLAINEIETMYGQISRFWESSLPELHISNRALYNLITLKKEIENKHWTIQETVAAIMRAHGAEEKENGALQLPPEKVKDANKDLTEFSKQDEDLSFNPIPVTEKDSIPSVLMEIFYDFIVLE